LLSPSECSARNEQRTDLTEVHTSIGVEVTDRGPAMHRCGDHEPRPSRAQVWRSQTEVETGTAVKATDRDPSGGGVVHTGAED
jgi:hypothetical protein